MSSARLALTVAAVAVASCGGPQAQTFPQHRSADLVVFVTFGAERPAAFDPRSPDPRVHEAYDQLTRLVGHEIEFHFDDALVPHWVDFDALFARCLETVAQDLARLRRDHADLFASAAPRLDRIEVAYDATAEHPWSATADAHGNVRIVLVPDTSQLVPEHAVSEALREAEENHLVAAYEKRGPDEVPAREWSSYVDYLVGYGEGWDPKRRVRLGTLNVEGDAARLEAMPRARVVLAMTRLAELVPEGDPTAARVRVYLLREGLDMLEYGYHHDLALVRRASPASPWKRAEAAWVGWLLGRVKSLPDDARAKLYPHLFVGTTSEAAHRYADGVFPGLDPVALGLGVFDAWVAAGHPVTQAEGGSAPDAAGRLYDEFVCARLFRDDGTAASSPNACDHLFYRFATDRPEARARFFDYVARKRDPVLATQVVANLGLGADALDLWQRLDDDDASWRAAARVLADVSQPDQKDTLWPEVTRHWRRSPAKHGAVLYVVLRLDRYHNGKVDWRKLPGELGGPVGRDDLSALLDMGPSALQAVNVTVPALSAGWSRMDVIGPRLAKAADPTPGLAALAVALCDEGNQADLAKLRAFATAAAHDHPSEKRVLDGTLEVIGRCKNTSPRRAPDPRDEF